VHRFIDTLSYAAKAAPSEDVKKSLVNGLGRRHRLPHRRKRRSCFGGAGGAACASRFFHGFSGSGKALLIIFPEPRWCGRVRSIRPIPSDRTGAPEPHDGREAACRRDAIMYSGGEEILIRDRNLAIAKIVPLSKTGDFDEELLEMAAQGQLRLPETSLDLTKVLLCSTGAPHCRPQAENCDRGRA
jgi:antitoxin (DNA-binding transcriptional repressor) of toxin-antitoxin stability system